MGNKQGIYTNLNRETMRYHLLIDGVPVYSGSGVLTSHKPMIEDHYEYTVRHKLRTHIRKIQNGTHINKRLMALAKDEELTIRCLGWYPTRDEALAAERADIARGRGFVNVTGTPGEMRKRLITRHATTQAEHDQIIQLYAEGMTQYNIGKKLKMSQPTVSRILRGIIPNRVKKATSGV